MVMTLIAGFVLQGLGLIGTAFWAFWGQFSAWGACGDGASEACLNHHSSAIAPVGEACMMAAMWAGQVLVAASIVGLLAYAVARLVQLLRIRQYL